MQVLTSREDRAFRITINSPAFSSGMVLIVLG
jgi:hypothetical protein